MAETETGLLLPVPVGTVGGLSCTLCVCTCYIALQVPGEFGWRQVSPALQSRDKVCTESLHILQCLPSLSLSFPLSLSMGLLGEMLTILNKVSVWVCSQLPFHLTSSSTMTGIFCVDILISLNSPRSQCPPALVYHCVYSTHSQRPPALVYHCILHTLSIRLL